MGRSKIRTFEYLKERVWKRIQGWKEKLLSKAGKGVLIKAVAQAIPSYAMSCFDLTKTLCDEISSMISRFWWAQQDKKNKMHWLSWELLCCRKEKGGLGYRDLHLFNLAMLARQGWRLLLNPDSLCAQVLRARYSSDLIDPMSGDWDRSLVNDVFLEEDAKYILSIPLKSGMEDSLAWHFDSKGEDQVCLPRFERQK